MNQGKQTKDWRTADYNQRLKEAEAGMDYSSQITNLVFEEMMLGVQYNFVEEICTKNYITKKIENKLLDEIRANSREIKKKKSDLAKEAISNGASRKIFVEYIID